jgi:hypothetical protein
MCSLGVIAVGVGCGSASVSVIHTQALPCRFSHPVGFVLQNMFPVGFMAQTSL